jgi:uncharacterized protein YbaP (TraB family)
MRKQILLLCGVLSLFVCCRPVVGQTNATSAKHSLWMVTGNSNVVYLLGSVHLLKRDDYPLAAPIESAFTNSQIAVFETDMAKMEDLDFQMKLMSKAQVPVGETIQDQLSPEAYTMLTNHLNDAGLPVAMVSQFKPLLAVTMLELIELQKLGVDPTYGVDKYFFTRAKEDGKEIVGLETVDFQIGLITEFTKEEGELVMKSSLKEIDQTRKVYGDMVAAWRNGDAAQLEKFLNDAMREAPAVFKRLVTDRNQRWVSKLEELLNGNKNVIVIVGAAHLVGNEGVVELLKKKGLKVTQL